MRIFVIAFFVLASLNMNAQWDTLNTNTDIRFNAIATDDVLGLIAVGLNPSMDSGAYGAIFASGDNGNTWFQITPHARDKNIEFWDAGYTSNGRAWVVGDSGRVLLQTIWFVTYDCNTRISAYSLRTGYAVGDSTFYCAGEHGVAYRTLDRGATWDTLSTGTTETINDLYFSNAANGWIVCEDGYMAVTSDSGNTWTFVAQPMFGFYDIKSIDYQDTLGVNPYIVGSTGVAYFSINGGTSWAGIATGTNNTLNQIRFGTNNAGLMCGDNGFIFRTDNAGWSWFADSSETNVDLYDIAYAGDTTAFICGDSGVVLRSRIDISSVQQRPALSFAAGVYPNPSTGPLNIQLMLGAESDLTIDVMDLTGQIVHTEYHENVSAGESVLSLNMEAPAAGVYFVRISNGFSAVTLRVIHQ